MSDMKCYAVMGHPVSHSLSPKIHTRFARESGISFSYDAIDVPLNYFSKAVRQFFEVGNGLNVTLPFKQEAFELADEVSERASCAEAVNVLWIDSNSRLKGDNTDGAGLVVDLTKNLKLSLKGKRILVLGAGGAVRGVLKSLLNEHPDIITLVNRTPLKAKSLAKRFSSSGDVQASDIKDSHSSYDLVINGTSAGFEGKLPPIPEGAVSADTIVYDMAYGKATEALSEWACSQRARQIYDGLGMLVEQAAESFFLWHGIRPDTQNMIHYLRHKL